MCRKAPKPSTNSSIGVPFSRCEEDGPSISVLRRHDDEYGKGTALRTCAAADRTGHAMLHTLYGQSLRTASVLHRVFRDRPDQWMTTAPAAA